MVKRPGSGLFFVCQVSLERLLEDADMDIYDFVQNRQIAEAKNSAQRAQSQSDRMREDLREARRRIDRLCLINQALWECIRDKIAVSEEDLLDTMTEIDLRDGTLDGKMSATASSCPQCGRPMSSKHHKCLYCGYQGEKPHAFQV